jgi:hypothetical protein
MSSRDSEGDAGAPAPAAGAPPPSLRSSHLCPHPTFPPPAEVGAIALGQAQGSPPPRVAARQGFLAASTPQLLTLDPQALPPPFSTPGDAFLQFVLQHFNSLVCSPVAPGSPLFAPSPVHIAVRHERRQPVSSSSVSQMLQFWIGSSSENLVVVEVGQNVFRLIVASPRLASFFATLGGLRHGLLLALFSLPFASDALVSCGPFLGLGPLWPAG